MTKSIDILVVDDEPGIRDLLTRVLEPHGYHVDTAKDGSEAIAKEKKKSYPLVFIDIIMPGKNGLEIFLELKKIDHEIKGIMITGYAVEDLIKKALAAGAYACVKKPFKVKNLLTLTKKALENKKSNLS